MLSTVNQHKSKVKTVSVRSIILFSKAASRFSTHQITEHFHSKLAVSIALSMGVALTGCGAGNNPTTRTDAATPPKSTVRTSYNLTVQSSVLIKNVRVTVTDTESGAVLGQAIIQNGNESVIEIPIAYLKTNNVLLITLSQVDSTSEYFDPMLKNELGAMASFNQSLHALVSMGKADTKTKVDPFSEIIYERTLIRSGMTSMSQPNLKAITTTQLTSASNEMTTALGTSGNSTFSIFLNSSSSIAAINLYDTSTTGVSSLNTQASNTMVALGQLALYAGNNLTAQTPYLDFAARASLDLLDGDLDGLTIYGGDTAGTVQITSPILYSGITSLPNIDPDHTELASLIAINTNQRNQRGAALKLATTQYFSTLNASLPLASRTDSVTLNYIQNYDFSVFSASYSGYGYGSISSGSRSGAGNYTLAFGLPTGIDSKQALDASDASSRSNDIMQLNGTYENSSGCKLSVGYDGTIQLSQGALTYQASVDRKYSDRLIRLSGNQYLMNVASADLTAPRFIQIRTIGAQIIRADAGRSTNQIPMTLDTTELSCNF